MVKALAQGFMLSVLLEIFVVLSPFYMQLVVDEAILMGWTHQLHGELLDPLKTSVVQNQRSMTTWVLRKVQ